MLLWVSGLLSLSEWLMRLSPELVHQVTVADVPTFDCNLACGYCCVRSSPDRVAASGLDRVRQLAAEAVELGVSELVLTGGEPFVLPDIVELVHACTVVLPTTLLTTRDAIVGSTARGAQTHGPGPPDAADQPRLAHPRPARLPTRAGSWDRAVAGIGTARTEGFRVKVAATLPAEQTHQVAPFRAYLETLGIPAEDRVIRALAHRGSADHGIELTVETLVPEITVTATGVYWHPVSAEHADQLVTRDVFLLQTAIDEVRRRFARHRSDTIAAAQWFPCA